MLDNNPEQTKTFTRYTSLQDYSDFAIKSIIGIILFVTPLAVMKNEFIWIKISVAMGLLTLGIIVIAAKLVVQKSISFSSSTVIPVMGFMVLSLISALIAPNYKMTLDGLVRWFPGLLLYFLIISAEPFHKKSIFWLFFLPSFAVALYGLLQYFNIIAAPFDIYGRQNSSSTMGLTGFSALYLAQILPISILGFCNFIRDYANAGETTQSIRKTVPLIAAFSLTSIGLLTILLYFIICKSVAGWIGLLVSLSLIFILSQYNKSVIGFKSRVTVALIVLAGVSFIILHNDLSWGTIPEHPLKMIVAIWQSYFALFVHHPFMGIGFHNGELGIQAFLSSYLQKIIVKTYMIPSEAFNEYLQIAGEQGLIGLIMFGWLVYSLLRTGLDNIKHPPATWSDFGLLGGIVSTLSSAFISFPFQIPTTFLYFWFLAGAVSRNKSNNPSKIKSLRFPQTFRGKAFFYSIILLMISIGSFFSITSFTHSIAENHIKDGIAYRNKRDFTAAYGEFTKAIQLNPSEYVYYFHRAIVLFNMGELQQTISDLNQSLKLSPYFGLAYRLRGGAYFALNNCAKAAPDFARALYFLPPLVGEIGNQAVTCDVRLNNYNGMVKIAQLQLKYNPEDKDAYYNIGNAMFLKGDYKAALNNYKKCVKLDPLFHGGWLNIAMTYYYQKDFNTGDTYFEKAKKINPDNPIVWYDHAVGLALEGKKEQALLSLQKAVEKKPELRMSAREEPSFDSLKHMPAFKRLVSVRPP